MNTLPLTLVAEGRCRPLEFTVRRLLNAGYVGRDHQAVQAHIDELSLEGIPPPSAVPVLFRLASDNITTAERIEVLGGETSGEIEYVLLAQKDELLVGVGSDHTDRALEKHDLAKSKQICKNVVSRQVWRYQDVKDHWDELTLASWVRQADDAGEVLYQKTALSAILPPEELLGLVRSRLGNDSEGLVIFSGTIPVISGRLVFASHFRGELRDPRTGQSLTVAYQAARLD